MVLSPLPPAEGGGWPRWLGALDYSAVSLTHPLLLVYQPRSGAYGVSALPAPSSRCSGPSAPLASGRLAPFRRQLALPGEQLLSFSPRDGRFEVLQCQWSRLLAAAGNRTARVDPLSFQRSRGAAPLPCAAQTRGIWPELVGHELSLLGERLLAYDEANGRFSVWNYDTDVTGTADPLRASEGPLVSGSWKRKFGESAQQLTLLGRAGLLLQRDPSAASYALWDAAKLASPMAGAHPMDGGATGCARGGCAPTEMQSEMQSPLQPAPLEHQLMSEPSARPPPKGDSPHRRRRCLPLAVAPLA